MNEEEETIICPWCNHAEAFSDGKRDKWFTWTSIKDEMLYLCWECTDKLHSAEIAREKVGEKVDNQKG